MPYVDSGGNNRPELEPHSQRDAMNAGELNFQITCLIDQYVAHNLDYQAINDVMGVLSCAGPEFYRRVAVPYEQWKCEVNGDVFVTKLPSQAHRELVP